MSPWTFTSDDGRFEMAFIPVLERASCTDLKLIKSDQHQIFGLFSGTAVLDDGTKLLYKTFSALPSMWKTNGESPMKKRPA
jgi:hypothetical protein